MQIEKGSVVSFYYTLLDESGSELESNRKEKHPAVYLHGYNNVLPKLEEAFAGKSAGDKFELSLEPTDAYGLRRDNSMERIPAKYLKHEGKLRPGQIVQLNLKDGPALVSVVKVGKFSVDIDTNHPFAGKQLNYQVDVVDVREASEEEKAHGHVHGVGGHQH